MPILIGSKRCFQQLLEYCNGDWQPDALCSCIKNDCRRYFWRHATFARFRPQFYPPTNVHNVATTTERALTPMVLGVGGRWPDSRGHVSKNILTYFFLDYLALNGSSQTCTNYLAGVHLRSLRGGFGLWNGDGVSVCTAASKIYPFVPLPALLSPYLLWCSLSGPLGHA